MISILRKYLALIKRNIELSKYDDTTIANYFRKKGAKIGNNCRLAVRALGTEPYLVRIGNNVTIAAGVLFFTHDGGAWVLRKEYPNAQIFGPIIIEDGCVIGRDTIILGNVRIGKNSIVGAKSFVISDVKPDSIVIGVPARPFGSVEKYKEKAIERWIAQKPEAIKIENGKNWWQSRYFKYNRQELKKHLVKIYYKELNTEYDKG